MSSNQQQDADKMSTVREFRTRVRGLRAVFRDYRITIIPNYTDSIILFLRDVLCLINHWTQMARLLK